MSARLNLAHWRKYSVRPMRCRLGNYSPGNNARSAITRSKVRGFSTDGNIDVGQDE